MVHKIFEDAKKWKIAIVKNLIVAFFSYHMIKSTDFSFMSTHTQKWYIHSTERDVEVKISIPLLQPSTTNIKKIGAISSYWNAFRISNEIKFVLDTWQYTSTDCVCYGCMCKLHKSRQISTGGENMKSEKKEKSVFLYRDITNHDAERIRVAAGTAVEKFIAIHRPRIQTCSFIHLSVF